MERLEIQFAYHDVPVQHVNYATPPTTNKKPGINVVNINKLF